MQEKAEVKSVLHTGFIMQSATKYLLAVAFRKSQEARREDSMGMSIFRCFN